MTDLQSVRNWTVQFCPDCPVNIKLCAFNGMAFPAEVDNSIASRLVLSLIRPALIRTKNRNTREYAIADAFPFQAGHITTAAFSIAETDFVMLGPTVFADHFWPFSGSADFRSAICLSNASN